MKDASGVLNPLPERNEYSDGDRNYRSGEHAA